MIDFKHFSDNFTYFRAKRQKCWKSSDFVKICNYEYCQLSLINLNPKFII